MDISESGKKVVVFGAGGPVGAVLFQAGMNEFSFQLTDVVSLQTLLEKPCNPLWPGWLEPPAPPHRWSYCDILDIKQVEEAMRDCDMVINLAVNRSTQDLAFKLNVEGTYNIMKTAAKLGIKRVIQGGVWTRVNGYEGDYRYEFDINDDVPFRAGTRLYAHTKAMGLHVIDAFARHHKMDVITLLLSRLRPEADFDGRDDDVPICFSVSWRDLGKAFLCALKAPKMESPNERFFITAELPFQKYNTEKAKTKLAWQAEDKFEDFLLATEKNLARINSNLGL